MHIASYNAAAYNRLISHETAHSINKATYLPLLEQGGKLICDYGLQDRLGITLLHKHYDVDEGQNERLVRTFNPSMPGYVQQTSPRKAADVRTECIPLFWKCEVDNRQATWYPYEFLEPKEIRPVYSLDRLAVEHPTFLKMFSTMLITYNAVDLFGLYTRYADEISFGSDQMLTEVTQTASRSMFYKYSKRDRPAESSLQTLWTFVQDGAKVRLLCDVECTDGSGSKHSEVC